MAFRNKPADKTETREMGVTNMSDLMNSGVTRRGLMQGAAAGAHAPGATGVESVLDEVL